MMYESDVLVLATINTDMSECGFSWSYSSGMRPIVLSRNDDTMHQEVISQGITYSLRYFLAFVLVLFTFLLFREIMLYVVV